MKGLIFVPEHHLRGKAAEFCQLSPGTTGFLHHILRSAGGVGARLEALSLDGF
jgi:hypothetical protein